MLLTITFAAAPARAQVSDTWNSTIDGVWSDPANWLNNTPPNAGGVAAFPDILPDNAVITLDLPVTLSGLIFDSSFDFRLQADDAMPPAGSLTFDNNTAPATIELLNGAHSLDIDAALNTDLAINNTAGSTFTLNGILSGSHGVTISGTDRVLINNQQAYTGGTLIDGGLLAIGGSASLVDTGDITVRGTLGELRLNNPAGTDPAAAGVSLNSVVLDGGILRLNGDYALADILHPDSTGGVIRFASDNTHDIDLSAITGGLGDGAQTRLTSLGDRTLTGALSFEPDAADKTLHLSSDSGTLTIDSALTAANEIEHVHIVGGDVALEEMNDYTGQTVIESGTLTIATNQGLGIGTGVIADGTVIHTGGTLELDNNLDISDELIVLEGGGINLLAPAVMLGPIQVAADGSSLRATSVQLDDTLSGDGGLTFAGDVTLTSASSLSGAVHVESGLLNISSTGSLVDVPVIQVDAAGNLRLTRPAGMNPASHSIASQAVNLDGGGLILADNIDPVSVLNPMTTGGVLLLEQVPTFNAGGTNLLDLQQLPGAASFALGAASDSTIAASVIVKPDTETDTLRLGRGSAQLDIAGQIVDTDEPTHLVFDGPGQTALSGANSFTGQAVLHSGEVHVNHIDGLGSTTDDTIIHGGLMQVHAATSESMTIDGGELRFLKAAPASVHIKNGLVTVNDPAGIHAGDILIDDGQAVLESATSGMITQQGGTVMLNSTTGSHTGDYQLNAGTLSTDVAGVSMAGDVSIDGSVLFATTSGSSITYEGEVSGMGDVVIQGGAGGLITFDGPYSFVGDTTQAAGEVIFGAVQTTGDLLLRNGTTTLGGMALIDGDLLIENDTTSSGVGGAQVSGELKVGPTGDFMANGDVQSQSLVIDGGNSTNPGLGGMGTVNVTSGFVSLIRGHIDFDTGSLASGLDVVKTRMNEAELFDLGSQFDGRVLLEQGHLRLMEASALSGGAVHVGSRNAALIVDTPDSISQTIHLDNASGFGFGGGLLSDHNDADFSGVIDLGDVGSTFGGPTPIGVSGQLQGGGLRLINLELSLTSDSHTYTGVTTIGDQSVDRALLTLAQGGALSTTERIITETDGRLELINTFADAADRVADHIPIEMHGGQITFEGLKQDDTTTTETLGDVTLDRGQATFYVAGGVIGEAAKNQAELTLTSLMRNAGATADFQTWGFYFELGGDAPDDPRLFIADQSPTNFLGGAYTYHGRDFVQYEAATGVRPLASSDYTTTGESTWMSDDNVAVNSGGTTQLTGDRTIHALRLFHGSGQTTVDVGDNTLNLISGGLINAGHIIEGDEGGRLTVGGDADGELFIHTFNHATFDVDITDNPGADGVYDAVPGGALDADNGQVSLTVSGYEDGEVYLFGNNTYSGATTVNHGRLIVGSPESVSGGDLVLNGGTYETLSAFDITADQFIMHGGRVIGPGRLVPQALMIEGGELSVPIVGNASLVKTTDNALWLDSNPEYTGNVDLQGGVTVAGEWLTTGPGVATVHEGAVLVANGSLHGYIDLQGGALGAHAFSSSTFTGQHMDGSSRIRILENASVQTFSSFVGAVPTANHVTISSDVVFADLTTLSVVGDGELRLTGTTFVGSDNAIDAQGPVRLQGVVESNTTAASLNLLDKQWFSLNSSYRTHAGQTLTIRTEGEVEQLTVSGDNRFVAGDGTIANDVVVQNGAQVMPGQSPGQLTFGGDLTVDTSAGVQVELAAKAFDRVAVTGDVSLAGELAVQIDEGLSPTVGQVYDIVTYQGTRTGRFDSVSGLELVDGLALALIYDDDFGGFDGVVGLRASLVGDANFDNEVGIADLALLSEHFGREDGAGYSTGDFNQDGIVGIADLALLSEHFGTIYTGPATVLNPEPATGVIGLVMFGMWGRRRRRAQM